MSGPLLDMLAPLRNIAMAQAVLLPKDFFGRVLATLDRLECIPDNKYMPGTTVRINSPEAFAKYITEPLNELTERAQDVGGTGNIKFISGSIHATSSASGALSVVKAPNVVEADKSVDAAARSAGDEA